MADLATKVKDFLGTWVEDTRDDNFEKFLKATGEPEDTIKYILTMHPKVEFTLGEDGYFRSVSYPMPDTKPDYKFDVKFHFDEEFDYDLKDEHLDISTKITAHIDHGKMTYTVKNLQEGKKDYSVVCEVVDGKLIDTETCGDVTTKLTLKRP